MQAILQLQVKEIKIQNKIKVIICACPLGAVAYLRCFYISNPDCRVSDTGSSCVKCPRGQAPSNDRLKCGGKLIIDNNATNLADIGNYF